MRSWDAFQIPLPFAKAVLAYGEPIEVPVHADRQVMEVKRLALQEALDRLADEAEAVARGDRRGPAAKARVGRSR